MGKQVSITEVETSDNQESTQSAETAESTKVETAEHMMPVASHIAVRNEAKAAREELAAFKAAQAAETTAAAEAQGEYQRLYEELKTTHATQGEQLTSLQGRETLRLEAVSESNTARFAALPEQFRELVDTTSTPDAVATMLSKLEKLSGADRSDVSVGTIVAGSKLAGGTVYPPDVVAEAKKHGKTAEWWFTNVTTKLKGYVPKT